MKNQKLSGILEDHRKWLKTEEGGKRADLRGADLRGADLQGADLQYADLQDADLQYADLQAADLRAANLRDADLRGAYLQGAYLQGADLRGADLQGAHLQGADLRGAKGIKGVLCIGPIGSRDDYLTIINGDTGEIRISTGCFRGRTLEDFKAAVEQTHDGRMHGDNYRAAIALIESYRWPER